ncbi:MAG TPA: ABC transporter ATP-binding protein [bacterium]|nr:ABC transporter ATP-binding protein [bacterium]HQI48057.1 ABC transporter ATP-binding protein [bacterium]HQJ65975.1 ABC transporter ATP-binding protein [bacterium]
MTPRLRSLRKLTPRQLREELLPNILRSIRLVWQASPSLFMISTLLLVLQSVLPLGILYTSKLILDGVAAALKPGTAASTPPSLLFLATLVAGLVFLQVMASSLHDWLQQHQSALVQESIMERLHAKSVEIDFAYYENPEFFDTLHQAQHQAIYRPSQLVGRLQNIIQQSLTLAGLVGLLFLFHWSIPLLLLLTLLPALLFRLHFADVLFEWRRKSSNLERKSYHYHWLLTDKTWAKEVRVLAVGRLFRRRYRAIQRRLRVEQFRINGRQTRGTLIAQLLATAVAYGFYIVLIGRTLAGAITLGSLVMYFQAFQQALNALRTLFTGIGDIYEDTRFVSQLFAFFALTPGVARSVPVRPMPAVIRHGLTIDGVSFRYPASGRWALQSVSFTAAPGERIALAGANGSGKSTLMKLICRLYDPTEGRILIDGIDIREFEQVEWWRRLAVMFQDFEEYNLSARENIWLGDIRLPLRDGRIETAADLSGASRVIAGLPQGYETMLGKWFDEGEELSKGEWQRIAVARAFLRDAPIMIFDEPTSALDARNEYEMLSAWMERVRGRVAILISHRISTLQSADRIIMMHQGRIAEVGNHAQLWSAGGPYAELFNQPVPGRP